MLTAASCAPKSAPRLLALNPLEAPSWCWIRSPGAEQSETRASTPAQSRYGSTISMRGRLGGRNNEERGGRGETSASSVCPPEVSTPSSLILHGAGTGGSDMDSNLFTETSDW